MRALRAEVALALNQGCGSSLPGIGAGAIGMVIVAIGHTSLFVIAQAGAARQEVHAAMQAALQSDACFGHCFWHSHPGHWYEQATRLAEHVCAHA
jgi:hypothetical protein